MNCWRRQMTMRSFRMFFFFFSFSYVPNLFLFLSQLRFWQSDRMKWISNILKAQLVEVPRMNIKFSCNLKQWNFTVFKFIDEISKMKTEKSLETTETIVSLKSHTDFLFETILCESFARVCQDFCWSEERRLNYFWILDWIKSMKNIYYIYKQFKSMSVIT